MFPEPLNIGSSHLDRNFGNMRNFSVLIILWTLLILLLSTTTSSPLTCTYWFTQECPGFWKRNPSHIMLARLLFLFIFILVSSFLDYIWNLLNKHTLLLMNVLAWFSGIKWVLINRTMLKWVLYLSKVTTKKNCNGNVLLMKTCEFKYIYAMNENKNIFRWWRIYFALVKKHSSCKIFIWIFFWCTNFCKLKVKFAVLLLYVKISLWYNLIKSLFCSFAEAWRHHGNDVWWSLLYFVDGTLLNLHRFDL